MAETRRRVRFTEALLPGFIQGALANYGDEIAVAIGGEGARQAFVDAERGNPTAFGIANLIGNVATTAGLASKTFLAGAKGLEFLKRGAAFDAALGGFTASGGYDPAAKETPEERLRAGATGALAAGSVAGLIPAAFSGLNQARLNAPVLAGKPAMHADQFLKVSGDLTPNDLVGQALARDEAARRAGSQTPTIFGPHGSKELRPVDIAGPDTESLFGLAMRDPEARGVFTRVNDEQFRAGIAEQVKGFQTIENRAVPKSTPKPAKRPREIDGLRQDLIAALDDGAAHKEWTTIARELRANDPKAAYAIGGAVLKEVEKRAATSSGGDLAELSLRLDQGGDLQAKLQALGVEQAGATKTARQARALRQRGERVKAEQDRPREERRPRFSSADDNLNSKIPRQRTGRGLPPVAEDAPDIGLRDWEAQMMMGELLRPRRVNYVGPSDARSPLFDVQAKSGAKWENPFVAAARDDGLTKGAYYSGKFIPPFADQIVSGRGISYVPQDFQQLMDERNGRRKESVNRWAPNRWVPA